MTQDFTTMDVLRLEVDPGDAEQPAGVNLIANHSGEQGPNGWQASHADYQLKQVFTSKLHTWRDEMRWPTEYDDRAAGAVWAIAGAGASGLNTAATDQLRPGSTATTTLKVAIASGATFAGVQTGLTIPVVAGQDFEATAWLYSTVALPAARIVLSDFPGSAVSLVATKAIPANTWTQITTGRLTAAATASCALRIDTGASGPAAAATVWIDRPRAKHYRPALPPTAYRGVALQPDVRGAGGMAAQFFTEPVPVTPGTFYAASYLPAGVYGGNSSYMVGPDGNSLDSTGEGPYGPEPLTELRFQFLDAAGAVISTHGPAAAKWYDPRVVSNRVVAPAGAVSARIRLQWWHGAVGVHPVSAYSSAPIWTQVQLHAAATDGDRVWTPRTTIPILGKSFSITTDRKEWDVSELVARFKDAELDPNQSTLIRKGKRVQLLIKPPEMDAWWPIFTGKIRSAKVTYELKERPEKRAHVDITATDALTELANDTWPDGYGQITDLRWMLEQLGYDYNIDGATTAVTTAPTVVARTDTATAKDQVAITRDSAYYGPGKAWIDVAGLVRAEALLALGFDASLGDNVIADLDMDYDTDRLINEVVLKVIQLDGVTGETTETTHGPYRDEASIAEWGAHSATFTVQRAEWFYIPEYGMDGFADYAQGILDRNAIPVIRVNSAVIPIKSDQLLYPNQNAGGPKVAAIDLCDSILLANAAAGMTGDYPDDWLRVNAVSHKITPRSWSMEVGFSGPETVSSPSQAPSPGEAGEAGGSSGPSLAQQLRPVGEVTMFFGSKADCPAGWLVLDGSSFSSTDYPQLYTFLGNTTLLPDFQDRVPVGTSVAKALGTAGGAESAALTAANLPEHTHDMSHGHTIRARNGTGAQDNNIASAGGTATVNVGNIAPNNFTGSTGAAGSASPTAVSRMQPWRSLHFIIRAKSL